MLLLYFYSHAWVIAVRLSTAESSVLFSDTNEDYPTRESFETYLTAGDDELYIVAEISAENYPVTFTLGNHNSTFNISDFSDLDDNGPLIEGRDYSIFVRFFSFSALVSGVDLLSFIHYKGINKAKSYENEVIMNHNSGS